MQLSDLNSGDVISKSWLNPIVNVLKARNILAGTETSIIPLQAGSSTISGGGGTITLTASDVVGGLYGILNTSTVNLPSSTDIQNFIGTLPSEIIFYYFTFKVYVRNAAIEITFNLGAGMSTFDGLTTFKYTPTNFHDITFALMPLGWKVFY